MITRDLENGVMNGEKQIADLTPISAINTEFDTKLDKLSVDYPTAITEAIDITSVDFIRQTASGITTSITGEVLYKILNIKNASGGDNIINLTIESEVSPVIKNRELFKIRYNGTDWDMI